MGGWSQAQSCDGGASPRSSIPVDEQVTGETVTALSRRCATSRSGCDRRACQWGDSNTCSWDPCRRQGFMWRTMPIGGEESQCLWRRFARQRQRRVSATHRAGVGRGSTYATVRGDPGSSSLKSVAAPVRFLLTSPFVDEDRSRVARISLRDGADRRRRSPSGLRRRPVPWSGRTSGEDSTTADRGSRRRWVHRSPALQLGDREPGGDRAPTAANDRVHEFRLRP